VITAGQPASHRPGAAYAAFLWGIYHAAGVQRKLRNHLFPSGTESAGFAGLK